MSIPRLTRRSALVVALVAASTIAGTVYAASPAGPKVGDEAKDFELPTLDGGKAKLSDLTADGPVVLVVLRGYPGYQCPLCTKSFGEYLGSANEFQAAKAKIVFVYPGPADNLKAHAGDFVGGKTIPANIHVLLDPDYAFTNAYELRWDAKNETAYPSTFVVGKDRKVTFAKVSTTHGGRVPAADALKAVAGK